MVNKTKPGAKSSAGLKFRPTQLSQGHNKNGTRPVPEQTSPQQIFVTVLIHLCRKVLFVDPDIKLGLYLFMLFVGSTVGDFLPLPRSYFSDKNNVLNQYFVKLGWGWTISLVSAFVMLTANVYCCGQRRRLQKHITRLVCATLAWYVMTSTFLYIESVTAVCRPKTGRFTSREACADAGFRWSGFDISGHAFILIFNSLFIVEEARAICGWAGIKDMIRNEDFARKVPNKDDVDTPLQHISDADYEEMKVNYTKHTPFVHLLFVLLTMLTVLWDFMLIMTILYFHTMVQKMCGGLIGIFTWYFLYKQLYPTGFACMPGKGAFTYQKEQNKARRPFRAPSFVFKRRGSSSNKPSGARDDVPKFMGMPLNALRGKTELSSQEAEQ